MQPPIDIANSVSVDELDQRTESAGANSSEFLTVAALLRSNNKGGVNKITY